MSKKKKTLREKKLSDTRRPIYAAPMPTPTQSITYSIPAATVAKQSRVSTLETMISLTDTLHDLRKSLTISAVIIVINIVIYILVANNLIPMRLLGL